MAAKGQRGPLPAHGTHSRYINHGCRCNSCAAAHTRYMREYKIRRAARDAGTVAPATPADRRSVSGDAALVAAVRAELEPVSEARPALVAIALRLAETLSDPSYGSSHAGLAKQLMACLDEGRAVPRSRSRLASVVQMSPSKPPC